MKIIEALKKIKDLQRKADDLVIKAKEYCADWDCEQSIYPDQRAKMDEWLQGHSDIIKEILDLRVRIQRTNLDTQVTIELGGKYVTKSITEWIHRRTDLAKLEENIWLVLSDKGRTPESKYQPTPNSPITIVKRRLYYDPSKRDNKVALYRSEPSNINAALEIINATTDLK